MNIPVRNLLGIGDIPRHRTSASAWMRQAGIPLHRDVGNGGSFEYVKLSDLPSDIHAAWEARSIEEAGLPAGEYDEATHERFVAATPAMQTTALRKAEIARFLVKGGAAGGRGLTVALAEAARDKFGPEGTDKMTLRRILRAVVGVDPVNFGPALLPAFQRKGAPTAEMSCEAWAYVLTSIRDGGEDFPLKQAWRDTRDVARVRGWAWPGFVTVWRRWDALTEAQKLEARFGAEEAIRRLTQPVRRDKTTIRPMEWVSLDGRQQDFRVDLGDGKPVRPTMLMLVDVASNFILGYELAPSENAVATARLIRNVCREHGILTGCILTTDRPFPGIWWPGALISNGAANVQPSRASSRLASAIILVLKSNSPCRKMHRRRSRNALSRCCRG